MLRNKFQLEDARVLFEGKPVGWVHTSRSTGETKAVAVLPKNKITVFGMTFGECEARLDRSYTESQANDD